MLISIEQEKRSLILQMSDQQQPNLLTIKVFAYFDALDIDIHNLDSFDNRKRMMKCGHLLQYIGIDLGDINYRWYTGGMGSNHMSEIIADVDHNKWHMEIDADYMRGLPMTEISKVTAFRKLMHRYKLTTDHLEIMSVYSYFSTELGLPKLNNGMGLEYETALLRHRPKLKPAVLAESWRHFHELDRIRRSD